MNQPFDPQPEACGLPSARAQAEGSGLTLWLRSGQALSSAFPPAFKDGAWRRRTGQKMRTVKYVGVEKKIG